MYAVGDAHSHMSPVGDGGGEEELWHVRSGWMGGERRICGMYAVGDAQ